MSKPLIIASDQSLTSSTCTDTSNTTDSNENPDVEKRRRVKPETILELEERPVSSASDGELAEVERARERMERMYAKDQEGP